MGLGSFSLYRPQLPWQRLHQGPYRVLSTSQVPHYVSPERQEEQPGG